MVCDRNTVAMLGASFPYAYAPASSSMLGAVVSPSERRAYHMLGQDSAPADTTAWERLLTEAIRQGPEYVRRIKGDPAATPMEKAAADEAAKRLGMSWFERNQGLVVTGGVLALVAVVAVMTTQKRSRRRR